MIKFLYPKSVKEIQNVSGIENIFIKKQLQIGLSERNVITLLPNATIVLDFGKEIRGGIRILTSNTQDIKTARVRIRFGESLSECYANLGEKNATNDHSPRDMEVDLSSWSDLSFGDTGFRFVRIDSLSKKQVNIKAIVAKSCELNKKSIYSYSGSDDLVLDIFKVAKRTIDLCSIGKYVYDGVKRDKLVWVGDMYPEMLALTTLYGKFSALENSLNFAKTQYPVSQFMYDMPTYSLWWILIVCDYYEKTNSKNFILSQIDYLVDVLNLFNSRINKDGRIDFNNYFIDWQSVGHKDEYIGAVFIMISAYKKAINLLSKFDVDTAVYREKLSLLYKNNFEVYELKQVIGLKYFALGEISSKEYKTLIENGAHGFSTFMSYFILKAIASKDESVAVSLMKEYYGGMLSIGATTFFEDFDLKWLNNSSSLDKLPCGEQKDIHGDFGSHCYVGFRHSLCHGWASGVIAFIKEHINR